MKFPDQRLKSAIYAYLVLTNSHLLNFHIKGKKMKFPEQRLKSAIYAYLVKWNFRTSDSKVQFMLIFSQFSFRAKSIRNGHASALWSPPRPLHLIRRFTTPFMNACSKPGMREFHVLDSSELPSAKIFSRDLSASMPSRPVVSSTKGKKWGSEEDAHICASSHTLSYLRRFHLSCFETLLVLIILTEADQRLKSVFSTNNTN